MLPLHLCVKNKDNIAVCLYVPRLIGFLSFWQPLSLHSNSFIFGEQPGHYVPTFIQSASLRPAVAVQREHTLSAVTKLSRLIMSNDSHKEFFRQAACQLTLGGRQGHHLTYRDKQLFTPTGNFHQLTKFSSLWSVGGKPEHLGTYADTGENIQTPHRKAIPSWWAWTRSKMWLVVRMWQAGRTKPN